VRSILRGDFSWNLVKSENRNGEANSPKKTIKASKNMDKKNKKFKKYLLSHVNWEHERRLMPLTFGERIKKEALKYA
jgi:hypothetical protein